MSTTTGFEAVFGAGRGHGQRRIADLFALEPDERDLELYASVKRQMIRGELAQAMSALATDPERLDAPLAAKLADELIFHLAAQAESDSKSSLERLFEECGLRARSASDYFLLENRSDNRPALVHLWPESVLAPLATDEPLSLLDEPGKAACGRSVWSISQRGWAGVWENEDSYERCPVCAKAVAAPRLAANGPFLVSEQQRLSARVEQALRAELPELLRAGKDAGGVRVRGGQLWVEVFGEFLIGEHTRRGAALLRRVLRFDAWRQLEWELGRARLHGCSVAAAIALSEPGFAECVKQWLPATSGDSLASIVYPQLRKELGLEKLYDEDKIVRPALPARAESSSDIPF